MEKVILVDKPLGNTPLQAIKDFKKENPAYRDVTISYAGRLDPMAEGILLLLIGEENKKRKKYEDLPKSYETEIVFGITTDTFDSLGIIKEVSLKTPKAEHLKKVVTGFIGKQEQKYPPYSSKSVNGRALYWWARRERLSEIEIPNRQIEIYKIKVLQTSMIPAKKLVDNINKRIENVEGDFRQEEILKAWAGFGKENEGKIFLKIRLEVACSSGTYIRRLALDIGEKLACGAFCLSIKRTRIGDFEI